MKRHADTEGRAESPGPLFDIADPTCRYVPSANAEPDSANYPTLADCKAHGDAPIVVHPRTFATKIPNAVIDSLDPAARAESRRDLGMSRASSAAARKAPGWEEEALEAVREFARGRLHFATEDVRAVVGTPEGADPKCWGPLMKRAQRAGIVEADGFVLVNCSNRSPRVRWRSLVFKAVS